MPPNKATNESMKPLEGSTNSKDQWKNHNGGHFSYNDGYHSEHSGYSDHDGNNNRRGYGYGNSYSLDTYSGNDYSIKTYSGGYGGDHHGAFSGSGCCPGVVDPLTMLALVGGIALATYFFEIQIRNSMLMMARKKRRKRELNLQADIVKETLDTFNEGKLSCLTLSNSY